MRCGRAGQRELDRGQPTSFAESSRLTLVVEDGIMPPAMLDVLLLFLHKQGVNPGQK
jgi:hypothetical protein